VEYTVIGRDNCLWCVKAAELLEDKSLNWSYYNLDLDKWLVTLMVKAGYTTVPLIFGPDNKVIGGYTELEALLKDKESKT
jgi:glutaredoxin